MNSKVYTTTDLDGNKVAPLKVVQLVEAERELEQLHNLVNEDTAEIMSKLEDVKESFKKFAWHLPGCAVNRLRNEMGLGEKYPLSCNCGFDEAKRGI